MTWMMYVRFLHSLRDAGELPHEKYVADLVGQETSPTSSILWRGDAQTSSHANHQDTDGRWVKSRTKNGHLPLRRRKTSMPPSQRMQNIQKFAAVHGVV